MICALVLDGPECPLDAGVVEGGVEEVAVGGFELGGGLGVPYGWLERASVRLPSLI